jgi:hypothetical protein
MVTHICTPNYSRAKLKWIAVQGLLQKKHKTVCKKKKKKKKNWEHCSSGRATYLPSVRP